MKSGTNANIALVHYTTPSIVGGVEVVMQAHAGYFLSTKIPLTVVAGRGSGKGLPAGANVEIIPEMDSRHPLISEINSALVAGTVPASFELMVEQLFDKLLTVLAPFTHIIVHNIFTKHFNLPLTVALHRLLDKGIQSHWFAWCHDFTWTSPNSRSRVHPGYPWDVLRTYRDDLTYIVVSQYRQNELVGLLNSPIEKIHVVPNGVDPKTLLGLSPEGYGLIERLGLFDSDLVLLMPVRITQAKNIEYAMQVIARLKGEGLSVRLVITGPPDPHDGASMAYFRELKTLGVELGVTDQVCFIFESGEDKNVPYLIDERVVGDIYRVSDIMFMPSHREGFGMPILEAGLVGIPVLSTDVPAAKEVGKQDVLRFDRDENPSHVADLVIELAQTSPVYQLRRRVRQKYTWDAIFNRSILPLLYGEKQ
ncbi:MAG: glycosyltransferase family 4 protein [Anaerolineales bacterium]|nr:glycosyltransferase family 4 protein [Anaerolineales bacterium]